jgi:hypothetical protein
VTCALACAWSGSAARTSSACSYCGPSSSNDSRSGIGVPAAKKRSQFDVMLAIVAAASVSVVVVVVVVATDVDVELLDDGVLDDGVLDDGVLDDDGFAAVVLGGTVVDRGWRARTSSSTREPHPAISAATAMTATDAATARPSR